MKNWQTLIICSTALFFGQTLRARDITTISGTTYLDVKVGNITQDSVSITHRDGVAVLKFTELPLSIRAEFTKSDDTENAPVPEPGSANISGITTTTGTTYINVKVTRVETSGIRITHRDGVAFLDFLTLPVRFRNTYGYSVSRYATGKEKKSRDASAASNAVVLEKAEIESRRLAAQVAIQSAQDVSGDAAYTQNASIASRSYTSTATTARDYSSQRYSGGGYSGGVIQVRGYTRKDGTYVRPHTRRR